MKNPFEELSAKWRKGVPRRSSMGICADELDALMERATVIRGYYSSTSGCFVSPLDVRDHKETAIIIPDKPQENP